MSSATSVRLDVLARIEVNQARLEMKLDQLLAACPRPTLRRADRTRLASILPAVTGVFGSEPFATRDLFEQAAPALDIVLAGMNTKSIAQLFSRSAGQDIEGYVVQHAGRELNAKLWRVVRAG